MTIALDPTPEEAETAPVPRAQWLIAAGIASIGAGAIHAAAIGVHAEHRPAALTFTVVAAVQIVWGGLAMLKSARWVAALGLILNAGALVGWVMAKIAGIGFIDGLDVAESVQLADGLAAALAAASLLFAGVSLAAQASSSGSRTPAFIPVTAMAIAAVTIFGMTTATNHSHAGGGHGEGDHHEEVATASHGHSDDATGHDDGHQSAGDNATGHDAGHATGHDAPVAFDPTKPIDLGGVDGVTAEQQAEAENVLAVTLVGLPQWADYKVAEAAGFRSIGDGATGIEHFVNQEFMDNETMLDPDEPESLVYNTEGGGKRLVAAMYMTTPGLPLDDVPDIGGKLMQWHIHNNLCYGPNGRIGGLTDSKGNCRAGLVKPPETPMIHVWIESHPCGPFAALEGIGAGEIKEGEERLCDEAHGAH